MPCVLHQLLFLLCPCRVLGMGEPWQSSLLVLWEAGSPFPPQLACDPAQDSPSSLGTSGCLGAVMFAGAAQG